MPQFDKITFFNQIFWLFLFFSGFHLIFLKIFLPKLSSVLKLRNKKLQRGASSLTGLENEQNNVTSIFHSLIETITIIVKTFVLNYGDEMSNWISNSLKNLNETKLKKSNILVEKTLHKQFTTTFFLKNLE